MKAVLAPDQGVDRPLIVPGLRRALGNWHPPIERREFWFVQGLVLLIAVGHFGLEAADLYGEDSALNVLPPALFLIPVVYAALKFGLRGSLLTAIWSCLLVVPNLLLWHEGAEAVAETLQMGWVLMVAIFVGIGVDRERQARFDAEEREEARRLSEERYRAIFDSVAEPIVVLDAGRLAEAANAAAATLFGHSASELLGRPLPGSLGAAIEAFLDGLARDDRRPNVIRSVDPPAWIEPLVMPFQAADGTGRLQLMLLDVTTSHERERGLQEIARKTMLAREEEGRRIARELHDGPVQTLVALWGKLDQLEDQVDQPAAETLVEARAMAESVAAELRRVSRDLRPSVLDDLGVAAAVRSEGDAFASRSGLATRVEVTGTPRRLDPIVELALLRITQEALRNVERHGHAHRVTIGLAFRVTGVKLSVADDGRGLDPVPSPTELLASDHLGLIGMRERARVAGAELSLRTSPMGGLLVEVRARA